MKLAHEYALEMAKQGIPLKSCKELGWKYADAMQDEADKREQQEQNKLKREQQNHQDELVSIGLEEWQPDWSQAPIGYDWFCVGSNGGYGFFSNQEPEFFEEHFFVGADGFVVNNHGYQGNWKESLRKRPEPKCEVDWRVAPSWAKYWAVRDGSSALWCASKPTCTDDCLMSHGACSHAPSFGFTGTHIVERPDGF